MTAWAVCNDRTLHGRPLRLYWTGGLAGVPNLTPFRALGPGVATFPTAEVAAAAFIRAGGFIGGCLRVTELADTGPPGGRDDSGGSLGPAAAKRVVPLPPSSSSPTTTLIATGSADYGTADRHEGSGTTPGGG